MTENSKLAEQLARTAKAMDLLARVEEFLDGPPETAADARHYDYDG